MNFRKRVLAYWKKHGRHDLPWRKTTDPYRILISEVMLQQTQVERVIPFYRAFLRAFPAFRALARAPVAKLLRAWQGLGYNRRALMLKGLAQIVMREHGGVLPNEPALLRALPGIGPYTAAAIGAFAFNLAQPMIETNIRRVYLHHYFPGRKSVSDTHLMPVIKRTLDRHNSRRWYGALMDYGAYLAANVPKNDNPNRRSRHYVRQSKFEGSDRQIRGAILKRLIAGNRESQSVITTALGMERERIKRILISLERDGFIVRCTHAWCVHNPHWALKR